MSTRQRLNLSDLVLLYLSLLQIVNLLVRYLDGLTISIDFSTSSGPVAEQAYVV